MLAISFALSLALVAPAQTAPTEKPTVLVLDLEARGVEAADAHFLTSEIGRIMSEPGTLAALEGDKQAAGCDAASCLAEIASAMGAAYVVFGSVGRVENLVVIELSLFEAAKARAAGRRDLRGASVQAILEQLPREVHALAGPLLPAYVEEPKTNVLLVVGGAVAGAGALLALGGGGVAAAMAPTVLDEAKPAADRNGAKGIGAASTITAIVGTAVLLVGGGVAGVAMVTE
jgi:hypothetical protein